MNQRVCVPAALMALLVLTVAVPKGQSCPRSCNCYQANEVHCTFRSLLTVPPGLPAHTRRINLGFNSISRLHDGSLAGLKKAELLMLHSNDLHHLPDGVFRDMKSLQILKLSYNKLREISSSLTFSGLTSLLRLYLDHNLLQHIHPRALLQLPSLRLIRLQGNRLHQLHPHSLCTLSLLNTYYFSTLRHLDLSNNSLTTLPKDTLATAPLLETLVLQSNPWSCDCRMNWLLDWSLSHPGLLKCPGGPQCPVCATPTSLQDKGLLEQTSLLCAAPANTFPGKETAAEADLPEIQSRETFKEPLGSAALGLSDGQGNSVDLSCNITHSSSSQDIAPPPDLSQPSTLPLPLALSLSMECPIERPSYEKLWRILAYYSETAVRLEREIMLSKAPGLAYRYRQTAEADGYYHTGVKASVKARPHWLLQPAISIQLNRAQSNGNKVHLIYSTRVSTPPDPTSELPASAPAPHPWVLIVTNQTTTSLVTVAGSKVELPCPLLSSGNPKVQWILPDGSRLAPPSTSADGRLQASASSLLVKKVRLSDAGIYSCVAWAGRDADVLPLRLAVAESSVPPSGEQVGPPVMGTSAEPVKLSCEASGSPEPVLSWILPDGNVMRRGLAVSGGLSIDSNGSLFLSRPSLRDAGHYRCVAVNQYGSDSLSMQLILTSAHIPTLQASFPRGPQSAAGRSTQIRAPLFREVEEGSGDEEEEERTFVGRRKHPASLQPSSNRRYPGGTARRRGPVRESLPRRGERPAVSTEQRRNRFENRQRIDPQKWADILAKIRQKTTPTNHSQAVTTTSTPTAPPAQESKRKESEGQEEEDNAEEDGSQGTETEGSSVDDTVLQEEGLQPVQPVHTQATAEPKINTEIDGKMEKNTEKLTEKQVDSESETETERIDTQTEAAVNAVTPKESVVSQPSSGTNEIESVEGESQVANPNPSRSSPQNPRQGLFPNLVPNSRPQSPWNSRRKIGQQRRIINRPRGRPLTPAQPLPDPTNPGSQSVTPDTTTSQSNKLLLVSTATSPAILLTPSDRSRITPSGAALNPDSSTASDTLDVSTSKSSSSSPASSLTQTNTYTHTDTVTRSGKTPDTEESTLFNTPAPTHSQSVISETHVPDTRVETFTHGLQTHTEKQAGLSKHADGPPFNQSRDLKRNFLDVPHESHSSSVHSVSEIAPTSSSSADSSGATSTSSEDTLLKTTVPPTTSSPTTSPGPTVVIPTSSTTRQTTTTPTSSTTTTTSTTTAYETTSPTTTSTTTQTPAVSGTPQSTHDTYDSSTTIPSRDIPRKPNPPFVTASTTTTTTISEVTPPTTTSTVTASTPTSTASTTQTNTKALSTERQGVPHADPKERIASGGPNQIRPPTDWKNPGANTIPDSHRSRSHWTPASSLPVTPVAPAVRSRPRIADPHIRTASFPAESTARLHCEAQGEPKPSITWTKVATGAVMSVHSRAQRFEVLPNGTLVIQNVQQQDRGTYICSAQSFLGRDRLLTTLEVWTRPPRMQLPSYRESTIHQGGEVHLECQADGVPTPLVSWVLPNRSVLTTALPSTSRISMDTNRTLHISVTLPSDRGVYRCVASNSAGAASASVRVHVSSLPPVIQQSREEHLLLSPGRPVYAHCTARGAPPPTLRWRIPDGTLVRPSQFLHGNLFVLPNGTLHIRKVGPKDAGSYECSASNAVGANKRIVRVEIKEGEGSRTQGEARREESKPAVTEKPSSSLSPNKDRNWNLPTRPADPWSSTRFSQTSPSDRSRTFIPSISHSAPHPHNPSFSGTLPKINKTAAASPSSPHPSSFVPTNTNVSPSTNNVRVTTPISADRRVPAVLPPLPVSPFTKARIVSSSASVSAIHYGGILQLHCSVNGNPAPNIIWRTPNRKLVDMHLSYDRRMKVHPNGTLSVQSVTEKDAGDYLCIARNKVSDDYRLLRVSVATKPAKIEPKQPLNQMVSFGKPLKVDCQASGLPDPAVHWSLPDGTMVNSVLHGEDRGGRSRRLTVFDNGTLLVPAVGMREEGEYTCYAENQGGQDMMKVKVKVMMASAPTFTDHRPYHLVKVHPGATAKITCLATGDPPPTVTWFSPARRVIPQSSGSGYYSERVVVVSGGTLEVRQAQRIDTGNYTCRASNSAGDRSMVVGLEVEAPTYGQGRGHGWSIASGPSINQGIGVPNTGSNSVISSSDSVLSNDGRNGYYRPVGGTTTQAGGSVFSVGGSGTRNVGIKADNIEANRNGAGVVSGSNSVANSPSIVRGDGVERNPGTYNNEVTAGRGSNDANTSRAQGWLSGISGNVGGAGSSVLNSRGATSTQRENGFSGSNNLRGTNDGTRNRAGVGSNAGTQNLTNTVLGGVTTTKLRAAKGQTVIMPCPSQGSPPPRLAWLLPGNGMLPAPYYGSRLTVHRNGSLELRAVRATDAGMFVCVVRRDREEKTVRVELEVSEPQGEAGPPHWRPATEKPVQKTAGLIEVPQSGGLPDSAQSLSTRPASAVALQPRAPVTQRPLQRGSSLPAAPHPAAHPPFKSPHPEPAVSSRTAPVVSIINGETLRLLCPVPQAPGYSRAALSWTLPSGKTLSRGESAESDRYSVQEDGTLTVREASVFDRGSYTCRAASHDSSSVSAVTTSVIVIAYPPRITSGPAPVTYTRPGVAVELPCLTIATPRAAVTWEIPDLTKLRVMGQPRIYGNRYLSPQGSLVIQNPTGRDTGFYTCTAKNVIGVDTKATYLHVI